jgi:uncharacterized cupredoxin-like copper-binding protein
LSSGLAVCALAILLGLGGALSLMHAGHSAPHSIELSAREFLFDPREVTARIGEVAFVVKNQGAIEHDFVLEDGGGKTVAQIAIIEPGQTVEVKAAVQAGTYTIYCSLPGHREAGMVATLRVSP